MEIPEEQRQALLRLVEFKAREIEGADDVTLVVLYAALAICAGRNAKRFATVFTGAHALLTGDPPATRAPPS
jgi:hypothetical protein